jgi:nitroreductase
MLTQTNIFEVIETRRSVKQYDPSFKMSREEITELLEITQKAPSSWNLQQWKFFVIDDQAKKEQLLPIAYGQKQVVEASAVIAVLGDLEANQNAEVIYGEALNQGRISAEIKERLVGQINGAYSIPQVARDEAFLNASLASMQLMLAARAKGLDTCPMRGVNFEKFAQEFAIPSRYVPVMLIVVGKALKPGYPSSRFSANETIFWNEIGIKAEDV